MNNCNPPSQYLETRRLEILAEMEAKKNALLHEMSGVDKETLTKLRNIVDDYYNARNNLETIIFDIAQKGIETTAKCNSDFNAMLVEHEGNINTLVNDLVTTLSTMKEQFALDIHDTLYGVDMDEYLRVRVTGAVDAYVADHSGGFLTESQLSPTYGDSHSKIMSQKATTDYCCNLNQSNLVCDPLIKDKNNSSIWFGATSHDVVETSTPANAFKIVNTGNGYVRTKIPITKFESGEYEVGFTCDTGVNFRVEVYLYYSYSKSLIFSTSTKDKCRFTIDIDEFNASYADLKEIWVDINATVKGTHLISEIYCERASDNNGFWNPLFNNYAKKKTVDEISERVTVLNNTKVNNPLWGKIISFNGDSICEARATNGGGYATIIGTNNNMTVENLGVSGATIMYAEDTGKHCISRTVANMREDADYIILEGGVNDLYSNRPLGTLSNGYNATLDDTTFYGAFENMLKQALIRFHGKKIGYIAVHKMTAFFDSDKTEDNAYHAAIKCCKKWGIPVCDLNISCPPFGYLRDNPNTVFIPNLYTEHTATAGVGDGWHPNEDGYRKFYVPKIEAWLKTL